MLDKVKRQIEYGGFARSKENGLWIIIFRTNISELLCINRTKEKIEAFPDLYEPGQIRIKQRVIEKYEGEWEDIGREKMLADNYMSTCLIEYTNNLNFKKENMTLQQQKEFDDLVSQFSDFYEKDLTESGC